MKKIIFLVFTLLINTTVYSQEKLNLDFSSSCSFNGAPITGELYGFSSSAEAISIVDEIVGHIGLKRNFKIMASNVPNAAATIKRNYNGEYERYILYSQNFISKIINRSNTSWAAIGVMAHEIAHHLNGHTLKGPSRPPTELEADEFAGFILYKMGATLEQAQSMFNNSLMYTPYTSKTHPATPARLEAVAVGYQKAKEKSNNVPVKPRPEYKKNPPSTTTYPTKTSPSTASSCLLMAKGTGFYSQRWNTTSSFPENEISKGWNDEKYITSLSYGNGQWALIMSKGTGFSNQRWRTRTNFPEDEITKGWNEDYYITSLSYGKDRWALVMSKDAGFTSQRWRTRTNFPQEEISKGWDDDFYITSLSYGNGQWALVMSKGMGYTTQRWRTRINFPQDEIKKGWDEGYDITLLTHGNGVWVLVMSKGTKYSSQEWATRSNFPQDAIKEGWDEGKSIISVNYEQ